MRACSSKVRGSALIADRASRAPRSGRRPKARQARRAGRPALTLECSRTGKRGKSGSPSLGPTSTAPNGSMRGANAATPSPAITAAATAATPPPTKISVQGTPAASRSCPAIVRTPQGLGKRGQRQRLARTVLPAWSREPAELFFGQNFSVAPPGMQADDHGVEFPPVEALKQVARRSDPDFDQQLRVLSVHACDQRGSSGPATWSLMPMVRRCRAPANSASARSCTSMQFAGMVEKGCTARRKLHVPRRPLDQPAAEPRFEPLQLQADRGCVVRMASAARVKLPSSAMQMKAWMASRSSGLSIISGLIAVINIHSIPK